MKYLILGVILFFSYRLFFAKPGLNKPNQESIDSNEFTEYEEVE